MYKIISVKIIILSLILTTVSQAGLLQEITVKKQKVFSELSNLSATVDIEGLNELSARYSNEELDIIYFRLQKEIEKVPEFNLYTPNQYNLTLIQSLIQIIYLHSNKDYLEIAGKIKNLADQRLYIFPLYNELLVYQLDTVLLRGNIDLTKDDRLMEIRIASLKRLDNYINSHKEMVLSSIDLSKAPVMHLEYDSSLCARLF